MARGTNVELNPRHPLTGKFQPKPDFTPKTSADDLASIPHFPSKESADWQKQPGSQKS
jgi:hypothetical protein